MARIAGNDRPGWFGRFVYWVTRRKFGKVAEPVRIAAHNPAIFKAMCFYEGFLPRARVVDARGKELASLLTAMRVGCPF